MPLIAVSILSIAVQAAFDRARDQNRAQFTVDLGHRAPTAGGAGRLRRGGVVAELFGGRTARRAKAGIRRMIDPDRDLRRASAEVQISGNVDARRRLAEELLDRGQHEEASDRLRRRPQRRLRARSHTAAVLGACAVLPAGLRLGARSARAAHVQNNPDFKSADTHLLYARTLDALGALEEAENANTRPSHPATPGRKPGFAMPCC